MRKLCYCLAFVLLPIALHSAEMPLGKATFEFRGEMMFVEASIGNSGPLRMALDSGTLRTTLDEAVAKKLGLDLSIKAQSGGANGMEEISVVKDQTLHFAGADVNVPLMLCYPLEFLTPKLGQRIDGIIGVELFQKFVVRINYALKEIALFPPGDFSYNGPGQILAVTYKGLFPVLTGAVTPYGRDPIPTRFQLDTGVGGIYVAFWKDFVDTHQLLTGAREVSDVTTTGFGGSRPGKKGRIAAIQVGPVTIVDAEVRFNEYSLARAEEFAGNIGNRFLRRYTAIFDLPHDRLILEPPATAD